MKSIFIRLIVVEIILVVLIEIFVGLVFNYYAEKGIKSRINIYSYAIRSAIAEMGVPPLQDRARIVSEKIGIPFGYEGDEVTWATEEGFPTADKISFERSITTEPVHGTFKGEYYSAIEYADGVLMWKRVGVPPRDFNLFFRGIVVNALILLAVASVLSSLIIMRILRPIMWVAEGVKHLGRGNLNYRILEGKKSKSGRFGDLIKAFDDMTESMKRMLDARERLLLDVSHELRTPLTRMKVALELIPQSKEIDTIREDTLEMENMISQILETAKQRDGQPRIRSTETDIVQLIRETKESYDKQSAKLNTTFKQTGLILNIDSERIKSVLKNVIDNAIKYSGYNDEPVEIVLSKTHTHALIQVKDRGIGISPEDLPLVFEPFYRVDKSRSKRSGGYGLGLSLCKAVMEAHNGKIEIESVEGQGTTVSLLFPL
jgi:signal transduction histidine kinase